MEDSRPVLGKEVYYIRNGGHGEAQKLSSLFILQGWSMKLPIFDYFDIKRATSYGFI